MKNKFECFNINIFLLLIVFFIECVFIISICQKKISDYKEFYGIIYKDNIVQIICNKKDTKLINNNRILYYKNKRFNYSIVSVDRDIINNYNLILIKVNIKQNINDVVSFSVLKNKIKIIEMFKIIWKE